MPTRQTFILATAALPLLAIARDFPPLDKVALILGRQRCGFSWPPGLYFDESAFSEELASLNTTVVELNYIPDNEEGMVVGDERLEAMGEKGVETSARLKAVCAAVREMLQDKFTSFKSFCKFVDTYAPGNFRRRPGDAGAVLLAVLTALARVHPESNDPGPSSSSNGD
ncbi:hypothetical protein FOZ62_031839 [Perkinsus olseni]|uniref:Uncharacterized protein n=1 Tax=Perkinsus olseni TaxID=32597 RepID=A0A7J6SFB8_PEROL|nr:hypothetical protein FOZ62_031839 [Perkinsus olseni]